MSDATKIRLGERLRSRRLALGMTVKALAESSGLSARYVISAEHGRANLSVDKMEQLCVALDLPLTWLVSDAERGEIDGLLAGRTRAELAEIAAWLRERFAPRGAVHVALLGVRGAGKSAVGRRLAARLGRPFVELDARVEQLADLSLGEIFAVHGEAYYRRLELEALDGVLGEPPSVLATGGGIVTHPEAYARLRHGATTVWLEADPEDHWDRVIQQGDQRPMRDHPHAMAELRALLAARRPLYAQADLTVNTSAHSLEHIVLHLAQKLARTHIGV